VKAIVMRPIRPLGVAAILVPLAAMFGACSGSRKNSSSTGQGGAGGGSESIASSATGSGGADSADAAALDDATFCSGDAGAWQQLIAAAAPCQSGAECCVIVNPCLSQAQIVSAAQHDEASAVWPSCDVACVDCIAPAIEVACLAGTCVGRVVEGEPAASELRQGHCGSDMKVVDFPGKTGVHFGCGG
jgi:hypothetical protein